MADDGNMNTAKTPEAARIDPTHPAETFMEIERSIATHLMERYGPLLDIKELAETLKFPTIDALERSLERGHLQIATNEMPHRRGKFALAHNVARYLVGRAKDQVFRGGAEYATDLGKERPQ